ncbi:MAG: RNA polymerase sigma factor [Thermoleophilia bacterium]
MRTTIHDVDRPLLDEARAGSGEAADALVARHWRSAWRAARGITGDDASAEDVVQDAFVAALQGLDRFDPERGTFAAWLHRITVNRALNEVRRRRRRPQVAEDAAHAVAAPEPVDPLDAAFLDAIAGLKPDHRAVVVLRYGLDYTPPEIADLLDVAEGTVNSRLGRALATLRQTMESPHAG